MHQPTALTSRQFRDLCVETDDTVYSADPQPTEIVAVSRPLLRIVVGAAVLGFGIGAWALVFLLLGKW